MQLNNMPLKNMVSNSNHAKYSNLIDFISSSINNRCIEHRKKYGQFYTSHNIATYMASLIQKPQKKHIRILDAGAGFGILAIQAILECIQYNPTTIFVSVYEIDIEVIPYLKQNLNMIKNYLLQININFSFTINNKDFVLSRPDQDTEPTKFDISIINPPYFKYNVKKSSYAKSTIDLYKGDPNIYASFMAIAINCLQQKGQLISITPRSFTNGLYFKGFRNYILNNSSLSLIHIFKRRDKLFKDKLSSVLQENIICSFIKEKQNSCIKIRSSECAETINIAEENIYSNNLIIANFSCDRMIKIPETVKAASILKSAKKLESIFSDTDYYISTGPVVEHRCREYLVTIKNIANSVPLYRHHNVTPLKTIWNGLHKKDVRFKLADNHEKVTLPNSNYVLLRRFSTKDDNKRLIAGVYNKNEFNNDFIAFGNKINYIGSKNKKLSLVEAYGIAAVFNSSFMDDYFRCISGNTQVNATEIRMMYFPNKEYIIKIGKKIIKHKCFDQSKIDHIVNTELNL
jgi:adenine-specific DNA-methyltransferase